MTTQTQLDPFTTLVLNLTSRGAHVATVPGSQSTRVAHNFLLTQLLIALLKRQPTGHASPCARVFRIGNSQECRVGT
jgi:hypothetical protein